MRSLVRGVLVAANMKMRRHRQHPQAQRGRQREAESALRPAGGGQNGRAIHDWTNQDARRTHDITCECAWKSRPRRVSRTPSSAQPTTLVYWLAWTGSGMFAVQLGTGRAWRGRANVFGNSTLFIRAMSGDRQHFLLRDRRLRNWAAMFAVVALVAWVIEFASHLHVSHEAQVSAQSSHFCEMCAGFQAGASTAVLAHTIPKLRPERAREIPARAHLRLQLTHSYRSRAPPRA